MNDGDSGVGGGHHEIDFYDVVSVKNLLRAWRFFAKGKRSKIDVSAFELNLESNIFSLHQKLLSGTWKPDPYRVFYVQDPKLRRIHKASVTDRVLYQAVYQALYQIFDKHFICDSYASRNFKGTHRGVKRFEIFARRVTKNYHRSAFVLKCDVRKFFDSIDHTLLLRLIGQKISDRRLFELLEKIIRSFETTLGKALPLGNVTSQIFANIYLNELDQFVKHGLKARYYIRYCDDFVILSDSREELENWKTQIGVFLERKLLLSLHPNKVTIRKVLQGMDFLGYVSLPHYRILRTRTKRRMFKKIVEMLGMVAKEKMSKKRFENGLASYLGLLAHCKGERIRAAIKDFLGI
ncbi:MAG: reverse transcriptase domain-containing protein [bacterium]|nr:reverse transcriptase domain-containing protein [bacterium]